MLQQQIQLSNKSQAVYFPRGVLIFCFDQVEISNVEEASEALLDLGILYYRDSGYIKLTMSQFQKIISVSGVEPSCRTKKTNQANEAHHSNAFPETKNQQSKCALISHHNNKKLNIRSIKPSEIHFDIEKLGPRLSTRNRPEPQFQQQFHLPYKMKGEHQLRVFEKENRPSSMNELKYHQLFKIKTQFCSTERYESLHQLLHNSEKHEQKEAARHKQGKRRKEKIKQSLSRPHLPKVTITKWPKMKTEQDNSSHCQHQNKEAITLQDLDNSSIQPDSPMKTQINNLFNIDCSTIKLKSISNSKFLTNQSIHQLLPHDSVFFQDKAQYHHTKRKPQLDKIRKKFPQHFFR